MRGRSRRLGLSLYIMRSTIESRSVWPEYHLLLIKWCGWDGPRVRMARMIPSHIFCSFSRVQFFIFSSSPVHININRTQRVDLLSRWMDGSLLNTLTRREERERERMEDWMCDFRFFLSWKEQAEWCGWWSSILFSSLSFLFCYFFSPHLNERHWKLLMLNDY